MLFNITGSNDTIVVVNQSNIGGGSQANVLLLSGGMFTPVPPAPPVRGYQSTGTARY
jgi:hypothetical protein